jgi:hypothetical protein
MLYRLQLTIVLTCACWFAQSMPLGIRGSRQPSRSVVSSYCRMDYQGFRLAPETWPRMKALTTWKENPDWQGFTVVSQYELLDASEGVRAATVSVQYAVLGRFERGLGYTAEPGSEGVSFRLKDVDSTWKIEDLDPSINPHVSKPRAIAWLKTALTAEKDAGNKITLERALKSLGASP